MTTGSSDIIRQLEREILPLQGFKPTLGHNISLGLGAIEQAFPNNVFPTGALHECICASRESLAASAGFIAALQAKLMKNTGTVVWIGRERLVFPPALKIFGIQPQQVIFITPQKEKDILWVMEECLKCEGLASVTCEIPGIDFKSSRRLQLAMEQSQVTGFILRRQQGQLNTIASVARWQITPASSQMEDDMPGVGFPRLRVELLKARNGKPGHWEVELTGNEFNIILPEKHPVWLNVLPQYGSAI